MSYRQHLLPHHLGPLLPPVQGHGGHAALGQAVNEVPVIIPEGQIAVPRHNCTRSSTFPGKLKIKIEYLMLNIQDNPLPLNLILILV